VSNINLSLTYELPIAGGGTDFCRLCRIACQQIVSKYKKSKLFQALADTVMRANWQELKEERKMCEALRELFADDLRESREAGIMEGRTAGKIEGRIEGKFEGKIELII
jgi:tRNA C32,U32 (ribose-2'-O)-methylase TrmJ